MRLRSLVMSLLSLASPFLAAAACQEEPEPTAALAPIAEPKSAYAEVVANLRAADDNDGAYVRGAYRYYTRHDENGARVWCRAPAYRDGAEQILLTEKDVGGGSLGALEVSPNDKWVAFTSRPVSVDRYAVHIKDLKTGEIVAPVVNGADFSLAWGDDDALYYSKLDKKGRSALVYALRPHSRRLPKLIHEEKDRDREVMVGAVDHGPADHGPALFVRSKSSASNILAYRLNPLRDVEPARGDLADDDRATTPSASSTASATPPSSAPVVDAGAAPGGGSLDGNTDPAAHRPAVR